MSLFLYLLAYYLIGGAPVIIRYYYLTMHHQKFQKAISKEKDAKQRQNIKMVLTVARPKMGLMIF